MTSQHSQGSELQAKGKTGTGQWLSRLKGWMTASEPSAEALKKHKKIIYKNSGISLKDPQANTKLCLPAATIPEDAIKPASGPDPDDLARKRAQERRLNHKSGSTPVQSPTGSRSLRSPSMSSSAGSSQQDSGPRPAYYPC